ncbi:response regulator transcription factor [Jatrophihabitans telluris]|uniref:Response regulator transcription factor n=1 Tax=Jatrophihabitans telluris TaxID=2038343 RepID=A0ABY4QVN3_9ACTN|nr:response regulator transcription factor [Jatrophihabitans telluris]UQX87373.1 response regulator transcription factor [Jatrophihabitans telluris]
MLVIEDEPSLRLLLGRLLTDAGYRVSTAATAALGLQAAMTEIPDLVILDLILPDIPGEEVLSVLLASRPDARVLILSSVAEVGRRIAVLDTGAADFVAKPFSNGELLARVRARLRDDARPSPGTQQRYLTGHGFELDLQRRELVMGGNRIELSQREFVLLAHLLHRRGQVCTRQELLADVWGIGFDPGTNVVDVYVRRLRSKLATNSIETVRNVGYRFVAC